MKSVGFDETRLNMREKVEKTPLLEGYNLLCERNDRVLFHNVHFTLHQGGILQIAGPNGSGKTSLLRILCGLSKDYEGRIDFKGQSIGSQWYEYRESLLLLSHVSGVKADLTPRENLAWFCSLSESVTDTQIELALSRVGLAVYADTPSHRLSAGQQRRIALARLWLTSARIWILDEPFTAIDQHGIAELEGLLIAHAKRGGAIILTTHHQFSTEYAQFEVLDLAEHQVKSTSSLGHLKEINSEREAEQGQTL